MVGGKCGSLKIEVLESTENVNNRVTVIGDDLSDLVVASKADVVFARRGFSPTLHFLPK